MTRILILVGPTGSGKTATAIELCRVLDGEIISADSMQIYKGCDIVTAKVTPEEQQAAPHRLIDICDPRETYSAARWAQDAQAAIDDIIAHGKVPIIAGGTGFYINALLHPGTLAATPPNLELRAELEAQAQEHGNQWLHDKLKSLDADAATRLHPNDLHRVMRAIEIAVSNQQPAAKPPPTSNLQPLTFGLNLQREKLYARLNRRVNQMLQAGALDELKSLLASGVPRDAPALQGVGYRQLLPILDDEESLPEATELWKRDTRRYAKRQMTWFRHQLTVTWINVDETTSAEHITSQIVAQWHAPK
jgi:tRNA dimethylallyltransferase